MFIMPLEPPTQELTAAHRASERRVAGLRNEARPPQVRGPLCGPFLVVYLIGFGLWYIIGMHSSPD